MSFDSIGDYIVISRCRMFSARCRLCLPLLFPLRFGTRFTNALAAEYTADERGSVSIRNKSADLQPSSVSGVACGSIRLPDCAERIVEKAKISKNTKADFFITLFMMQRKMKKSEIFWRKMLLCLRLQIFPYLLISPAEDFYPCIFRNLRRISTLSSTSSARFCSSVGTGKLPCFFASSSAVL